MIALPRLSILILAGGIATAAQGATPLAELKKECGDCHDFEGPTPTTVEGVRNRQGPDLFYAGNKYRQAWLVDWLQAPERIRPAGMYYGNHLEQGPQGHDQIDPSSLVDHPALSESQAQAAAETLMGLKGKSDQIKQGAYESGNISLRFGEMMFSKFQGCLACHRIEPGYGGLSGPEVYTAFDRLQADYLVSYIQNPQAFDPKIFMPQRDLSDSQVQKLVHYLKALSEEDFQ